MNQAEWIVLAWIVGWLVTECYARWRERLPSMWYDGPELAILWFWPIVLPWVAVAHVRRGRRTVE